MRLASLKSLGERVLGRSLEVGKLSRCISNLMGFPQLLLPSCLAGAVPQQHTATKHRGTLTSLAWDEDNNPIPLHTHCGSQAWCLCAGDIQAQPIPVSAPHHPLVPREGSTSGNHRVSRDPEPKVCWQELRPQLRAPSPHPVRIWCVTPTNRGAHSMEYLSCPAMSPMTDLFTLLSWAD